MSGGVGAGTGMVLTSDGEILTNNHVVEGASQIVVTVVTTGESYRASIVGTDPEDDVAVLQLTGASDLQTIPLGDSDTVQVGDQVAAIGNAGGVGGTPSIATGRVTALGQQITASDEDGSNAETLTDMIQVDANVVPGDSGGPLANTSGEVIGMDSAAAAGSGSLGATRFRGGTGGGEGYAIPINKALSIAEELKTTGANGGSSSGTSTSGGYLGVQVQESADGGAEIVSVQSGSPAAEAGLVAGATIVAVDRTEITTPDELVSVLSGPRGRRQGHHHLARHRRPQPPDLGDAGRPLGGPRPVGPVGGEALDEGHDRPHDLLGVAGVARRQRPEDAHAGHHVDQQVDLRVIRRRARPRAGCGSPPAAGR